MSHLFATRIGNVSSSYSGCCYFSCFVFISLIVFFYIPNEELWQKRTLRCGTMQVLELMLTFLCTSPSYLRQRGTAHELWLAASAQSLSTTWRSLVTSSFRKAAEKPLVWGSSCSLPTSLSLSTIRTSSQVNRTSDYNAQMHLHNDLVPLIFIVEDKQFCAVVHRCNHLNCHQRWL